MNSNNQSNQPIPKSIASLQALGWRMLEQSYVLFTRLWTPVQLVLAGIGLTLAIYYGIELRRSLFQSQSGVAMALAAKVEPTRSTAQGITAVLFSNVKEEWTKPEYLNIIEVTAILQDIEKKVLELTKAQNAVRGEVPGEQIPSANVKTRSVPKSMIPPASELIGRLNLKVENSGSTASWQTAITSKRKESFMVVPATSLRRQTLNEAPLVPGVQSQLAETLAYNPEILFDLHLESEIEPIMQRLDHAGGERLTVVQTYFITESGTFLIRAPGAKDQGEYYGRDFQPYNQYMDRPYFWGAVDIRQRRLTPFDYGTKPYLDLGGNGFIVTFSKRFDLPNQRVGVLCVDAKLPDYVTNEIQDHLKSLGARVSDFYWSEKRGIEPGGAGPLPKEFAWFDVQLNKSREARSEVLGSIVTEPTNAPPTESTNETKGVVRFTVPVTSHEDEEGKRKTRLLWVEFNSVDILNALTRNLILFTAGIILVIAVTSSLFRDYTVLKREMSKVLKNMSKVMKNAPTPFVWLDEKNEFVDVNNSMLALFGYENIEGLRKDFPQFRGLVTAPTQMTYDEILENSAAGQDTGEYEIDVITKDGEVLHVRAHGERIPYPTLWRRGLPHRFGIFVEVIEGVPTIDSESARSKQSSTKVLKLRAEGLRHKTLKEERARS
jgi:PAS domain S-box-containing protein